MYLFSFFSAVFLLSPAFQVLVAGSPLFNESSRSPACNADNPFLNRLQYANSGYAAKLEETISGFLTAGDTLNAARTRTVQSISTFIWISSFAEIANFTERLDEAVKTQMSHQSKKLIVPFVIYNLPERDCAAGASAGELSLDNDGANKYKQFIDEIVTEITKPLFDCLDFAIILEPDSVGSVVTNQQTSPHCKIAAPAYIEGLSYAVKKLQQKNVNLYIDAAHSNWLGWPDNLEPAAKVLKQILDGAGPGAKIRGFSTNVANYNSYNSTSPDPIYGPGPDNPNWNELRYVKALTPYLEAEGLPAQFIIDQGRSGVQDIRGTSGGDWCNIKNAGFGIRPTTDTGECIVDSIVWVKPGGECDGTSNSTSARFNKACIGPDSDFPAPEAGVWFNEYAEKLVVNANPPLKTTC